MPSDEHHAKWQKKKRDNEDMDKERFAKRQQKDEAEQLRKLTIKCANNKASQKKWQDRLKKENPVLSEAERDSSVSSLTHII